MRSLTLFILITASNLQTISMDFPRIEYLQIECLVEPGTINRINPASAVDYAQEHRVDQGSPA